MRNSTPLVSAIVPTYNRAHVICEAVESIFAQTYPHIEVIVVDDGSKDATLARLKQYGDRIRVVSQANAGPAAARNRGIAVSHGEVIAFLDSDDIWLPTKIERQVALLDRAGESVPCCLSNCTIIYKDARRSSSFRLADTTPCRSEGLWVNATEVLSTRFILFNQAVAIRRSVLERVGYFDESLRFAEDYELPLRLSLQGPWVIIRDELTICHAANTDSWGERALREEIRYREDLLRMWKQMLTMVEADPRHVNLLSIIRRQVRRARRNLMMAHWREENSPGGILACTMWRLAERAWDASVRRSPLYARPLVTALS